MERRREKERIKTKFNCGKYFIVSKICECQSHFARFEEGTKKELPIFHGCRGAEVEAVLMQIESMFERNLRTLKDRKHTILDVKATSWHDDYNRFRSGVKDLEVMMQNAINVAFETTTTIQEGIDILDVFAHLQNREARNLFCYNLKKRKNVA